MEQAKTFEELVMLKQEEKIGWLEFMTQGDYAEDFADWCKECEVEANEEMAELFTHVLENRMEMNA